MSVDRPHRPVRIETERLLLRPFDEADLDALVALHGEPSFWWYPYQRGFSRQETIDFLAATAAKADRGEPVVGALVVKADGRLAGWAGLSIPHFLPEVLPAVEVGWRLGEAFRGRGYATEAGRAWVDHGFERAGLDELVSIYEPENVASGNVMRRLGFELDLVTTHPTLGVPLHVMRLRRGSWSRARRAGTRQQPAV
jgi:RimJ/RimL family protein N-acetyltransferase